MAMTYPTQRKSRLESRSRDRAEYKLIFAVSFAFFLLLSIVARTVRVIQIPFIGRSAPRKSLVAEASEAANSVLPYAFMG